MFQIIIYMVLLQVHGQVYFYLIKNLKDLSNLIFGIDMEEIKSLKYIQQVTKKN